VANEAASFNCFAGVAPEGTWNTPVAPDYYFNWLTGISGAGLNREYEFNETMDGQVQSREPSLVLTDWARTIEGELTFDGHEMMLRQLLGEVGDSDPVQDDDAYTWTFTPASQPTGLTLYANMDAKLYKYSGGKMTGATFTIGGGPVCTVQYNMVGGTVAADTVEARGDKTFYTYNPVKRVNASSTLSVGGTEVQASLTGATINIARSVTREATVFSASVLEPQISNKFQVTGELTGWLSSAAYTNIAADFEGGTDSGIIITLNGAGDLEYVFTMESCYLGPTGDPVASTGGLVQCTWPFWAWYDGTNDALKIEVTHATSTDYFAE